jgi:hypothetical protein
VFVLHYTVHGTPEGDIKYTIIPAGATMFCGAFTAGTYLTSAANTECELTSGQVAFPAGDVTRVVRCQ